MCKVWGVATRKGGVGKTTTSTTMAYLLAKAGYKVAFNEIKRSHVARKTANYNL